MKIPYPSFDEYQAALQSPEHCFSIPELKTGKVETDLWGLPRVRSGGFALTYKLSGPARALAVRCFHRHVPDRTSRYAAISSFLANTPSDIFVPIRYTPNGVLVHGNWFPITYMKWIEGETLDAYLVKNLHNRDLVQQCAAEFLRVVAELEALGIAHGDLSHRNIMVSRQKMVLVDYDGMYVPALQGRRSCEIGNVHFQLPGRSEDVFNDGLDRFSEIVIYLALRALAHDPGLLGRYETGGEGLLFSRSDFLNPYQSALLQELEAIPELAAWVRRFRQICTAEIGMVPRLADLISSRPLELPRREAISSRLPAPAIFEAGDRIKLLAKTGKVVTVVGKISDWHQGISNGGKPHIFLNFGLWRLKCFTIIVLGDVLPLFDAIGKRPEDYLNRWVSVNGVLMVIGRRPQIQIQSPTDLHLFQDEAEARSLAVRSSVPGEVFQGPPAAGRSGPGGIAPKPAESTRGTLDQTRDVLERLEALYNRMNPVPPKSPAP